MVYDTDWPACPDREGSGRRAHFFVWRRSLERESRDREMKEVKSGGRIAPELVAEIDSIARASDCELVQAELKGNVLRLILDKEEGISLGDCEQISKHVSAYLDVVDFGRNRYVLEVSSPGLDRQL